MRKIRRIQVKSAALCSAAALCTVAASCSMQETETAGDERICFSVESSITKSAPTTTSNIATAMPSFYSETFLVSGTAGKYSPSQEAPYNGENRCLASAGSTDGQFVVEKNWPSDQTAAVDFWAYGPAAAFPDAPTYTNSNKTITFSYSPAHDADKRNDAADQKDVVVAFKGGLKRADVESTHLVPLTFNHTLSAVRFKVGSISSNFSAADKIKITAVTIDGINGNGTCTATATDAGAISCSWDSNTPSTYIQSFSDNVYVSAGFYLDINAADATYDAVTDGSAATTVGEKVFMLIPQTVPDGATLTINWSMDGVAYVSRSVAFPASTKLEPGYMYTFRIDMSQEASKKDVDVTLSEVVPWTLVNKDIDYTNTVQVNSELSYSNCNDVDATKKTFLEGNPDICGEFTISSPIGSTFFVTLTKDFDAFEVIIDPDTETISSVNHVCRFYIHPLISNPERDYITVPKISIRSADGQMTNIDDVVQKTAKYNIVLSRIL